MKKSERPKFPEGFFTQPRPTVNMKEAMKNVVPFKWSNNVLNGKSKVKIVSFTAIFSLKRMMVKIYKKNRKSLFCFIVKYMKNVLQDGYTYLKIIQIPKKILKLL